MSTSTSDIPTPHMYKRQKKTNKKTKQKKKDKKSKEKKE
jgi:hypothetical protein